MDHEVMTVQTEHDEHELLTISEFSELTGIPRSTLIYYDEQGLFHPIQRGGNNYRYYSYYQTITIKLVNTLKMLDVPLKTIRAVIQARAPEKMLSLLSQKEQELPIKLKRLLDAQKVIQVFSNHIRHGLDADINRITVAHLQGSAITIGEPNDFSDSRTFYIAYQHYCRRYKETGGNLSYPVGGLWKNMNEFLQNPTRPRSFFSVDPDGKSYKPAGRYLLGYATTFYGEVGNLPERLSAYAKEHRLQLEGPMYNIFLLDEVSSVEPDKYLLQASIKIST